MAREDALYPVKIRLWQGPPTSLYFDVDVSHVEPIIESSGTDLSKTHPKELEVLQWSSMKPPRESITIAGETLRLRKGGATLQKARSSMRSAAMPSDRPPRFRPPRM